MIFVLVLLLVRHGAQRGLSFFPEDVGSASHSRLRLLILLQFFRGVALRRICKSVSKITYKDLKNKVRESLKEVLFLKNADLFCY
ncbi:hypothetical protein EB809_10125 [Marinobacter sp. R17]|nr:hypothetical protein EB809_10125 [Marinobacter sp. R17]